MGSDGVVSSSVSVHYTSYPLQTGASLFTFLHSYVLNLEDSQQNDKSLTSLLNRWPPFPTPVYPGWRYSKSEDPILLTPHGAWNGNFDYLVVESIEAARYLDAESLEDKADGLGSDGREIKWDVVAGIEAFDGVSRSGRFGIELKRDRKIVVLGRSGK